MVTGIVVLAALIAGTWLYVKSRGPGSAAAQKTKSGKSSQEWHAVAVRPGMNSCVSARRSNGARYLSREAPNLPLPGCDEANCTCRFVHYADRRAGEDRRTPFKSSISANSTSSGDERRTQPERRSKPANDQLLYG
ncbi:MAG: hypothetical protein WBM54_09720 [Woeseia sp.]